MDKIVKESSICYLQETHLRHKDTHRLKMNGWEKCFMQGEKTAFRIRENNIKWNNWQRINLKNIQATHAAQFQKNKWPNQKMGQRTKQTFRWLTNTWKDTQHHSLSEKCKSKLQWGTISCQSERLLSKSLQAVNAGEGVEKREPSYTVDGNVNLYTTMENSVEIP